MTGAELGLVVLFLILSFFVGVNTGMYVAIRIIRGEWKA